MQFQIKLNFIILTIYLFYRKSLSVIQQYTEVIMEKMYLNVLKSCFLSS